MQKEGKCADGTTVKFKLRKIGASALHSEDGVCRGLYPRISSHCSGYLKVSDLHTIYYEIFGKPNGQPAVFLHGGPGAGCTNTHACFFDPEHYRIVLFDQRGCGKSTPSGCLEENTTWDLVDDIEKLRQHIGVDSIVCKSKHFAGGWYSAVLGVSL